MAYWIARNPARIGSTTLAWSLTQVRVRIVASGRAMLSGFQPGQLCWQTRYWGRLMTELKISVIIPAHRPSTFRPLLRSIAANPGTTTEWIVVDDGSGPDFNRIFDELNGTPVRVIHMAQRRGQGAARNIGLARAGGRWIKFLDADDELDEGHLTTLFNHAQPGCGIPFAPTCHVFPNGRTMVNRSWYDLPKESLPQLIRLLHRPFLHHCGVLFPRELLDSVGGYDEELVTDEDGDLLIRILLGGYHFEAVSEVRYLYIHHSGEGRVSKDRGSEKLKARVRVCQKLESALAAAGHPASNELFDALAVRLDKIAMSWWTQDRAAAREILARARRLSSGYRPEARWPLRAARCIGGPTLVHFVTKVYRRMCGRPGGGRKLEASGN